MMSGADIPSPVINIINYLLHIPFQKQESSPPARELLLYNRCSEVCVRAVVCAYFAGILLCMCACVYFCASICWLYMRVCVRSCWKMYCKDVMSLMSYRMTPQFTTLQCREGLIIEWRANASTEAISRRQMIALWFLAVSHGPSDCFIRTV